MTGKNTNIKVVDLFAGIGGLTYGMQTAGLNVVAGIDIDETCAYGYEKSNKTKYIVRDIVDISSEELMSLYGDSEIRVLAGCAPCQPYSRLNKSGPNEKKMTPLRKYAALIKETKPHVVSMENVGGLVNVKKYPVFAEFLDALSELGYFVDYRVINTADYGVPQGRKRLVLLASRLGPIKIPAPTHADHITLRQAISDLPPIKAGEADPRDILHQARNLSALNLRRIQATPKDGGSQKSWPEELLLECHKKESGKSFGSVYGRMAWDKPASTMTTQCTGIGNGRFGHPEQDRAISLREAARIQTFPDGYVFYDKSKTLKVSQISKFIGNAVPVRLGEMLGSTIRTHVSSYAAK
jgi:DNA (cytosine-5)-methyltransferase 1